MSDFELPELRLNISNRSMFKKDVESPVRKIEDLLIKTCKDIYNKFLVFGYGLLEYKKLLQAEKYSESVVFNYIEGNFCVKETSAKNLMAVYQKFSNKETNPDKIELLPKFERFSFSKLVELLPVENCHLSNFYSYMTVRQIRNEKERLYPKLLSSDDEEYISVTDIQKDIPKSQTSDFLKSIADSKQKTEPVIIVAEQSSVYPNAISFKNNEQRGKFLETYNDWPLILDISLLSLKVHKITLSNEAFIVAYVYQYKWGNELNEGHEFTLFKPGETIRFSPYFNRNTEIIDYIRMNKLSIVR